MSLHNHPRRTTKTTVSPSSDISSITLHYSSVNPNMSLRKGATFHSPSSPTPDCELPHHFKVPSLPRRAHSSLDDVVDAHKRRVALTLGDIDRSLSSLEEASSPTSRRAFPDEADPVPQSFLDHTVVTISDSHDPIMGAVDSAKSGSIGRHSLRPRQDRRPVRYADSAIGSSIVSTSAKLSAIDAPKDVVVKEEEETIKSVKPASAITRSAAAHSTTLENLPRLSARANNRIHEHIFRPILAKKSLKDFHPIIRDCPRRIHNKEIVCLRDLEKTLMFMAPERTKTAALYLDFCLTSIRCIQATVEFLSDREQTRPRDRPYTNGYFVDLVDQIKQYAQQVQAAKEREAAGEKKKDEMDPDSTDEVKLHGGLTENGRPAELVRVTKSGKAISLATGEPIDLDEDTKGGIHFKRSLSEEAEDDESILRSMARRKRSASAAELAPKRCREPGCDKEFKRPCDLTKHEKTHSRPWKCPVETCKYHEYGWPTEKEMDRHHNDKHSAAPPMFECHFKPCPYRSKRQSNCKQHMEKAHGWEYVRSKNNGKNREKGAPSNGLPTPQTISISTPDNDDFNMQIGPDELMPYDANDLNFADYGPSSDIDIDMFTTSHQLQLGYSPISDMNNSSSSNTSPFATNQSIEDQFPEVFQDNVPEFTATNVDFNLYDDDLYSANIVHNLPTPNPDIFQSAFNSAYQTSGITYETSMPHISPLGQGNTMLYTPPTSLQEHDEGFEDFVPNDHQVGDFPLFPSTDGSVTATESNALFGEVPINPSLVGRSAKELLDFFAVSAHAAYHGSNMEWSSDDQMSGYQSH